MQPSDPASPEAAAANDDTEPTFYTEELRERGREIIERLKAKESFPGEGWPYDPTAPAPPLPVINFTESQPTQTKPTQ